MAQRQTRERPRRTLGLLAVLLIALFGSLFAGSRLTEEASMTPRLALDLEGGTQLILTPKTTDNSEVTQEDVQQAIEIIRQRVDASGVAEAEITSQGGSNIVVALPGNPDEETLDLVRRSAQLRFRPVLTVAGPGTIDPAALEEAQETPTDGATEEPTAEASEEPTTPPTQEEIEAAALQASDTDGDGELATEPATEPANTSDLNWITEQISYDFYTLDCTNPENLVGGVQDDPAAPLVACFEDGSAKFILGPTSLEGTNIDSASSGMGVNSQGAATGEWVVSLEMDSEGTKSFGEFSERLLGLQPPQNQFAIVLDGLVISNATMQNAIYDGRAQISGSFTSETAANLANQLNFGSLPLNFEVQSQDEISATLGSEQLSKGILAGLIGAGLVVLYMLWQYKGLGLLSVASLVLAGVITYGVIALMSWLVGYRLSLPGVVGLIVAVGITADSFIVYFERIRDEVREGRTLAAAVGHAWPRARRTILASDAVNFTAAAVLYFLAVGGVQGFAFTLGLVTLVDVVVVFMFTHPVMLLLVRTQFFGQGHRLSGLSPESLGATSATYRGRGQFRAPAAVTAGTHDGERELVGAGVGSSAATRSTAGGGPRGRGGSPSGGAGASAGATAGAGAPADASTDITAAPTPSLPAPRVDESGRRLTIAERRAAERAEARRLAEENGAAGAAGAAGPGDGDGATSATEAAAPDADGGPTAVGGAATDGTSVLPRPAPGTAADDDRSPAVEDPAGEDTDPSTTGGER
ncbi:protein translocase subunit SecD [Georgenia sp. EYE_87]|uniref:protein translocase subunit SecD n=1 Tax=Georgenia sp. EYE_87 TaxID=2853448 RepID=UPI002004FD37|nr:protein translocase subunit SecD [Georgenia sp. EYE_87]MCK6209248.1 protein translocase subunit SecD [Georgenia sp. EYE_87]